MNQLIDRTRCLRLIVLRESEALGSSEWIVSMRQIFILLCALSLTAAHAETGDPVGQYNTMDYGPFLSMTLAQGTSPEGRDNGTMKATIVRFGTFSSTACMAYDTELMRVSAAWTDGFIDYNGVAFNGNHECHPKAAGSSYLTTKHTPGWAVNGDFNDPRSNACGPLPKSLLNYHGIYRYGRDTIFSYSVGGCEILEMPLAIKSPVAVGAEFARIINIAPSKSNLAMLACEIDPNSGAAEIVRASDETHCADCVIVRFLGARGRMMLQTEGAPPGSFWATTNGRLVLTILPHDAPVQFTVRALSAGSGTGCLNKAAAPKNLAHFTKGGPTLWNSTVTTSGRLGQESGPYAVDSIDAPINNPWNAVIKFTALDFFPDGKRAALSTFSGDVWVVSGLNDSLAKLEWKRFATGLYQPLGLKIVGKNIYVTGRDQITCLHDLDQTGEADFYQNFNNDCIVQPNYHEFAMELETDKDGNFYYAKACGPILGGYDKPSIHNGAFLKLSKDGSKLEVIGRGLRAPNGIAIGPDGLISCTDNEGTWIPECPINEVKPGGFYGVSPAADPSKPQPTKRDPPICWLPWSVDNSSGGEVYVTSNKWGPFENEMLHLSYGKSCLFHVMTERIGGQIQGAVAKFPLQFASGIMRAKFSPDDGQLYVCGMKGWQTNAMRDSTFQRVRYTGKVVNLPAQFHITKTGVDIVFTAALNKADAEDVSNYSAWWFNIKAGPTPGSRRHSPTRPGMTWDAGASETPGETLDVRSAKLDPDGKTVHLQINGLRPVDNMIIRLKIKAADGTRISQEICNTINIMP